jgi:hypothetical protein
LDCEIYWVSKLLWKGAKCNISKTIISTAVLDRCQSWIVTNIDGGKFSISERKMLRKICGQCSKEKKKKMNSIAYTYD